jgi:ATP-dependent protease HslVU (ClpYQ) peptidase subunit
MTTIAARKLPGRGWQIAADSQETIEGEDSGDIKLPCQKIFTHNDGGSNVIVATAGDSGAGLAFVEHIRRHSAFRRDPEREFDCLVKDKHGKLWMWSQDLIPVEITLPFYAIGTGRMAAFAALEMGANVRRAVEIAAKYDPYTGGDIVVAE